MILGRVQQRRPAPTGERQKLSAAVPGEAIVAPCFPPLWPDTDTARAEALRLIQALSARLLEGHSATQVLETWCADHAITVDIRISARRVNPTAKPVSAEQRQRLGVGDDEPVGYRRVQLFCGNYLLSEADNWYVPGRLTPEMNHLLENTDTPYGKVVQALAPQRKTLAVQFLWPHQAETEKVEGPQLSECPREEEGTLTPLLHHHALLTAPSGLPLAEVVETYFSAVLAFSQPPMQADVDQS